MFTFHQSNGLQMTETASQDMELLQYDILYGEHYAYHGEDPYPASDLEMGVQDVVASHIEEQEDGLHIYGENFTRWSKVFVNGSRVSTSFLDNQELVVSIGSLQEGMNSLVVNQMGSSDTIFRSSNTVVHFKPLESASGEEEEPPVDDTVEQTPNSIDKAINGNRPMEEKIEAQ